MGKHFYGGKHTDSSGKCSVHQYIAGIFSCKASAILFYF